MEKHEIYEKFHNLEMLAIEYGEAQRDVERQINNEYREEPIEQTIRYSHEMYMVLTEEIYDMAAKFSEIIEKKEAE